MTNYKIIKLKYGVINLSEPISEAIITYCLGLMHNSELNYEKWKIGISRALIEFEEGKGKCWKCNSENEARDTKKYFVEDKIMTDDNTNASEGIYIYVKRP